MGSERHGERVERLRLLRQPRRRLGQEVRIGKAETEDLMESTICQKTDLEWATKGVVRSVPRAMFGLMKGKRGRK